MFKQREKIPQPKSLRKLRFLLLLRMGALPRDVGPHRRLERGQLQPRGELDTVAARRAELEECTRQVEAYIATYQNAKAEREQGLQTLRDLEQRRITSEDVTVEQIEAAKRDLWYAEVRLNEVLPPLRKPLEAAEMAAAAALEQAIHEAQVQRYNALIAQRVAALTGPLEATKEAFLEELRAELARIAAHQETALALGTHPGNAKALLRHWVNTAIDAELPPARDPWRRTVIHDLVAADPTLRPLTPEALAEAQRTGTLFVRYQGSERPHLQWQGLERVHGNPLNEQAFQDGKAIEVTHAEECVLRTHYGEAMQRTLPPPWW